MEERAGGDDVASLSLEEKLTSKVRGQPDAAMEGAPRGV